METGFEEIGRRAPWPAEAGEMEKKKADDDDEARMYEEHAKSDASTMPDAAADVNGGDGADLVGKAAAAAPRPETVRFQGMRMGYFCVDQESGGGSGRLVLNRIVSLKEDTGKD